LPGGVGQRYDAAVNIVIPIFDAVTALDAVGPYEVLSRLAGADVRFVAATPGARRTDNRFLAFHADHGLDDLRFADILVVPGGFGTRPLVRDERILGWTRDVDLTTRRTTSVCTGSLVLAAAGLLHGPVPAHDRVTVQPRRDAHLVHGPARHLAAGHVR
jgi:putative intracellular protease/amidase